MHVALRAGMPSQDVARFFSTLADETRLTIVRLLSVGDLRVGELVAALQLPANAVSYHLKQLRSAELVRDRRSSADARDVYYHVDLDRLEQLYFAAGDALYPGMAAASTGSDEQGERVTLTRPLRVLFLCTHNSARSQLAEAILRQMGGEQVEAFSAGSDPTEMHPEAAAVMRQLGIDPAPHQAKPLQVFTGQSFDYIITVCDRVRDHCPVFPGDPLQIHWSVPDPVVVEDPEQRRRAFREVAQDLTTRIRYLLLLPHPGTGERLNPRR
jgi:protein-tyrosine-phosphatase